MKKNELKRKNKKRKRKEETQGRKCQRIKT